MSAAASPSAQAADLDAKAKRQRQNLNQRINANAKAAMTAVWAACQKSYKPAGGDVVKNDDEWKALWTKQEKLMDLIAEGKSTRAGSQKEYDIIMAVRKAFPVLAKKVAPPKTPLSEMVKTAALGKGSESSTSKQPSVAPNGASKSGPTSSDASKTASSSPTANNLLTPPHTGTKRKSPPSSVPTFIKSETIDLDEDDSEPDRERTPSIYNPEEDERAAKHEERAAKRHRTDDFAAKIKKATDQEDLEFELKEIELKAQMQKLKVEKKMAELKRMKRAEMIKKE